MSNVGTVYLVRYYDSKKDADDAIYVFIPKVTPACFSLAKYISSYLYPEEEDERLVFVISYEKIQETTRKEIKKFSIDIVDINI